MPNTLAHLGVGVLATRALRRDIDLRWALVGCVIPDLPWILARAVKVLAPQIDGSELRLYAIAQSSFALSLLLCAALAALTRSPRLIFAVLAGNSLLHLLLDAAQTKWGNGVNLLAPWSWEPLNLGLFWPESPPTYALTALGAVLAAWVLRGLWRGTLPTTGLSWQPLARVAVAGVLALAYLLAPFALRAGPEAADSHHVRSLRERERNVGALVAFDRAEFEGTREAGTIRVFSGERVPVRGRLPDAAAQVSMRGRLAVDGAVEVEEFHLHRGWPRDLASYVGLALVAIAWTLPSRGRPR